jgi:hypothetical protein
VEDALVRSVVLKRDGIDDFDAYPFSIPPIRQLGELRLDPHVTLFAARTAAASRRLSRQSRWPQASIPKAEAEA